MRIPPPTVANLLIGTALGVLVLIVGWMSIWVATGDPHAVRASIIAFAPAVAMFASGLVLRRKK